MCKFMRKYNEIINDKIAYTKSECMSGGAGNAFKAIYKGKPGYILKKLHKNSPCDKIARFENEIREMLKLREQAGIMPIVDYNIDGQNSWYLMPEATSILTYFSQVLKIEEAEEHTEWEKRKIKQIVEAILELARTLKLLHAQDIHHRDIKPQNIYYLDGAFCFGDFGLIDFPEKPDITRTSERIGPQGYMPDEARANTQGVDFKKVDIYELAKTLWVILTDNPHVFSGKYDEDDEAIGIRYYYKEQHHFVEIENILTAATEKIPQLRPSIDEFIEGLELWLRSQADSEYMVSSEWQYIKNRFFPLVCPEISTFTELSDIIIILKTVARLPGINHVFLPGGGGLDLYDAKKAQEKDCLELCFNGIYYITKPMNLVFATIQNDPKWMYVYLETDSMDRIAPECDKYADIDEYSETLTMLPNGDYKYGVDAYYGRFEDGSHFPKGSKRICRCYAKTSFVIFSKASIYNETWATYDGRHTFFKSDEFHKLIMCMKFVKEKNKNLYEMVFNKPMLPTQTILQDKQSEINIEDINKAIEMQDAELHKCDLHKFLLSTHIDKNAEAYFYVVINKTSCNLRDIATLYKEYVTNDCTLKKINILSNIPDDALLFANSSDAKEFILALTNHLEGKCQNAGLNKIPTHMQRYKFAIYPIRNKDVSPNYLLKREEVLSLLANGDDTKRNTMVVDVYGHPHLLENATNLDEYPVVLESFQAGNNYVGKYTDIENRDDEYLLCLEGWLFFLETGRKAPRSDVLCMKTEMELLADIMKYY